MRAAPAATVAHAQSKSPATKSREFRERLARDPIRYESYLQVGKNHHSLRVLHFYDKRKLMFS